MSFSTLIRWSGLAILTGGALFMIAESLSLLLARYEGYVESATTGTFIVQQMLFLPGAVLLLVGLVGLYARQSETAGRLGLAGFLIAFAGTALLVGLFFVQAFFVPYLATEFPEVLNAGEQGMLAVGFGITFLVFPVGWLLFGVSTLRAGIYPRAAAILLIIGTVFTFVPLPGATVVLDVAVAGPLPPESGERIRGAASARGLICPRQDAGEERTI